MKKVGRPPSDTEQVTLRLSKDVVQTLDQLRKLEADLPTRPEMIRRILQLWLEQNGHGESG